MYCGGFCLKKEVPIVYLKMKGDMYHETRKNVKSTSGETDEFIMNWEFIGGSALSVHLFSLVTKGIQNEAFWRMMFSDDAFLVDESTNTSESNFERWARRCRLLE